MSRIRALEIESDIIINEQKSTVNVITQKYTKKNKQDFALDTNAIAISI